MKIRTKLLCAFASVMIIFIVAGAGILFSVSNMNAVNDTVNTQIAINEQANNLELAQMAKQRGLNMYLQGNEELGLTMIEESAVVVGESQEALNNLLTDPELLEILNGELHTLEQGVEAVVAEMIMISGGTFDGKDAILATRLGDLEAGITIFNERLANFRAVTNANVETAMVTAQEYGTQVFTITAAGIVLGIVGSVSIAFYMGNRISSPIKQLSQAAHNTSLGNLDQELEIKTGDEIEELSDSFNRLLNSFKLMDAMSKDSMGDEEECLLNKTA